MMEKTVIKFHLDSLSNRLLLSFMKCVVKVINVWEEITWKGGLDMWLMVRVGCCSPLHFWGKSAPFPCPTFTHLCTNSPLLPALCTESSALWIKWKCVHPVSFKIFKCNPGERNPFGEGWERAACSPLALVSAERARGPLQSPANGTLINLFSKPTHEGADQCFALRSAVFGAHITALIYSL